MTAKHTPGPLPDTIQVTSVADYCPNPRADEEHDFRAFLSALGIAVSGRSSATEEEVRLVGSELARRWNAFPELLEDRKRRLSQQERYFSGLSPSDKVLGVGTLLKAWIAEDRAAIAKAEKGGAR
jgi:hypothetical protein